MNGAQVKINCRETTTSTATATARIPIWFHDTKISRRTFLAGTGALGALTAFQLNPLMQALVNAGVVHAANPIPIPGSGERVPTVCQGCTTWCMKEAYVQDGRVFHVPGNQHSKITGKSGCVRQSMALTELYDPDRVRYPMKRTNPRKGRGEDPGFVRITWEEAMDTFAEKLLDLREHSVPERCMTTRGRYFLALMSTGISLVLAYGLIMKDEAITRHTRPLLIMAIGILLGGFTALATELGSLLNMVWILLSPNPSSPIWWMGTLYSIELVLLFVKLVMDLRGRHGVFDLPLAWGTLVIAAAAAITIGAVFGTVIGRPDFHGAFLSVVTLVSALVSGAAAIVLLRPQSTLTEAAGRIFRQAALVFAALILTRVAYEAHSTVEGMLGWANIFMLVPFLVAAMLLSLAPRLLALVGILGVFWVQYSFIITGQLVSLGQMAHWYGAVQTYQPNIPEALILVLGIAVAAALIKLGEQFLIARRPAA